MITTMVFSGVPKFSKQAVGHNKLIPDMCKVAGIPGRKTGKVICACQQNLVTNVIKSIRACISIEALHNKYKQ